MMIGIAVPFEMLPVKVSACKIPTEADEDWTIAVMTVPASTPRIGCSNTVSTRTNAGLSFKGATESDIISMPNIRTAKPSKINPTSFFLRSLTNI